MTRIRRLAILDGLSYAVLVGALVAHLLLDTPRLSPVLGPIHGVIYLFYAQAVLWRHHELGWAWATTLPLLATPIVPLAGFYVAARMLDDAEAAHPAP